MKKIFVAVFILTVGVVGAFLFFWYSENKSTGSLTEEVIFVLEPGESAKSVALRLETMGAIQNRYVFLAHLAKNGEKNALQQGTYTLFPTDTPTAIADRMVNGEITRRDIKITFPEGWTARQMASRLTEKGFKGEEFLALAEKPLPEWQQTFRSLAFHPAGKSLEGFLFPDTYYILPEASAKEIIEKMLQNFDNKVNIAIQKDGAARGGNFYNTLILASIVEEEGRTEYDRGMIADIFWKRLAKGQPFQSDATVNYALGTLNDQPSLDDIETDSPYNTYKYAGLTPGPISNPGIQAIRATVYPTSNPYYYFLNNIKTREIFYAETFEGHVANREAQGL